MRLGASVHGDPIWALVWFFTAIVLGLLTAGLDLFLVWPLAMVHAYVSASNFNVRHYTIR